MRIMEPMRYLGIDYGAKRIGIAMSDDGGRMAFPRGIVVNHGNRTIREIAKQIIKQNIGAIIVGLPMGLGNKETEQTAAVRVFITALAASISVEVFSENEMLTSRMAAHAGMKDHHIDAASAAIILQSYLDRMNRKK